MNALRPGCITYLIGVSRWDRLLSISWLSFYLSSFCFVDQMPIHFFASPFLLAN